VAKKQTDMNWLLQQNIILAWASRKNCVSSI